MANYPFEIPHTLRDLSEQNLKQAHVAYEQLTGFVTKAVDAWMGAIPANPMTAGFKDVQGRVLDFAMDNAESAFAFAGKICNAPTPEEILTLQTQFAQERMQAFVTQTQQLFSAMGEALPQSERAAKVPWAGVIPSTPANPMAGGFKGVQDYAVAMAKKNAEAAIALVDKIAKSHNFQELFTLQVRFAQEHMQAYTAQMKELQTLIEETVQKSARG